MLLSLLFASAGFQTPSIDLDAFLKELEAPPAIEVLESLGPRATLESLLDPERQAAPVPDVPSDPPLPESHAERLKEIAAWSDEYITARRAGDHRSSAEWAARQVHERLLLLEPGHPYLASSYLRLGHALQSLNRHHDAVRVTLLALEIEWQFYGRGNSRIPGTLFRLAARLAFAGDFSASELAYCKAFELQLDLDGAVSARVGNYANSWGGSLFKLGRSAESCQVFERTFAIYEEVHGSESYEFATCLGNAALAYEQAGRNAEARECLQDALDILRAIDQLESRAGVATLISLAQRSPTGEARELFEEAYDVGSRALAPLDTLWTNLLDALGWELLLAGELVRAEECFLKSLEIGTQRYGRESREVAGTLSNLSGLMRAKGQYDQALENFVEAFELQQRFYPPDHSMLLIGWNNLGALYMNVGRDADAEKAWRTGLALAQSHHGPDHEQAARMLSNLGALLHLNERTAEAMTVFHESWEMRQRLLGDNSETADSAIWVARLLLEQGDLDAAEELARDALRIHRERWGVRGIKLAGDLKILAEIHLAREEFDDALEAAREAFEIVDAARPDVLGNEAERATFARAISHGEVAALASRCAIEVGEFEEAFSIFERARGRVLLDLLDRSMDAESAWPAARAAKAVEVRATLEKDERIRAYFWSDKSLIVFTIDSERVHATLRLSGKVAMRTLSGDVARLVQDLADPRRADTDETSRRKLAETLWPTEQDASGRWVVLPDGFLQALPFEVLPFAQELERQFIYASSATLYANRRYVARDRGSAISMTALGAPEFAKDSSLQALPATRIEVERACQLVRDAGGEARALFGDQATRARLEEGLDTCSILHLATHGHPGSSGRPYDAGLALTADTNLEGWLTLEDLIRDWNQKLPKCELVVLSACDTQRATRVGDSLMALPWGFFYAGAPSVLASLWKVDDRATALLMTRFYEELLSEARPSKLVALSRAKKWLANASRQEVRVAEGQLGLDRVDRGRSRSDGVSGSVDASTLRPYADPAYWAGFILLGSPD